MMDQFDEYLRKLAAEEPVPIPEDYHGRVFATLAGLEEETPEQQQKKPRHRVRVGWIAAALAVMIAVPNLSPTAAAAMSEIPVLGTIVEILTLNRYTFDDGHSTAEVEVPELGGSEAAEKVSQDVEQYKEQLLAQFELDREEIGEGYQDLSVSSRVVVNSEDWFTLRVDVVEIQASGYNYSRFYHIDKRTGKTVTLGDLMDESSDWGAVLADEVRRQMEEDDRIDGQAGYFPDTVEDVAPDQNFYWNEDGDLVLVFDEYSVAAGYAGMPEFTISREICTPLLKQA